jgi:cyclin-dependent kinase 8/11
MLTLSSCKENINSRRQPGTGYTSKVRVRDRYHIVGFISSGTYGRVYKALGKNGQKGEFAIKKSGTPIYILPRITN